MSEEKKREELSEERGFIRETIQEKQPGGSPGKRIAVALGLGCLFGGAAGVTFQAARLVTGRTLGIPRESHESISIPRDSSMPTELTTDAGETTGTAGRWETLISEGEPAFVSHGKEILSALEHSMAMVTAQKDQADVFEDPYTHSEETFGVIIAITGEDVRILTESSLLQQADRVHVSLYGGISGEGTLLGIDTIGGFAVISVPLSALPEGAELELSEVELGNSYLVSMGDMVVALGRPVGHLISMASGIVSYVEENVEGIDINYQVLHTDISGTEDGSGLLADERGRIIGLIASGSVEGNSCLLKAYSISDLKGLIESLSNSQSVCVLGVQTKTVTEELTKERGLPQGLFVTNVVTGTPALYGGLRSGDVILKVGKYDIRDAADLQEALIELEPGVETPVVISRSGRNGYEQMTLNINLEPR